jgi:hypothetical protein
LPRGAGHRQHLCGIRITCLPPTHPGHQRHSHDGSGREQEQAFSQGDANHGLEVSGRFCHGLGRAGPGMCIICGMHARLEKRHAAVSSPPPGMITFALRLVRPYWRWRRCRTATTPWWGRAGLRCQTVNASGLASRGRWCGTRRFWFSTSPARVSMRSRSAWCSKASTACSPAGRRS